MRKSTLSACLFSLFLLTGACAADLESGPATDTDTGNNDGNGSGNGDGSGDGNGTGDDPGDGAGDGTGNGDGTGDDPGDTPPDGTATVCLSTPDITIVDGQSEGSVGFQDGTTGPQYIDVTVPLTQGGGSHFLNLSLWDGYGGLSGGLQPGTIELTGDELSIADCGACVLVGSDATETEALMASGGSVTISAVSTTVGSEFTATLSNVTFRQIGLDENTGMVTDVAGGCEASLAGAQISATIQLATP